MGRVVRKWGAARLAFVVQNDRAADAVERGARGLSESVRPCASVGEAVRWLLQTPPETALPPPVAKPEPPPTRMAWPVRRPSREFLEASVALLRSLPAAWCDDDRPCVEPAATAAHRKALEDLGCLTDDVHRVLSLTTGFRCEVGELGLDLIRRPPDVFPNELGFLLGLGGNGHEGEGHVLEPGTETSRLWWIEHDGEPLVLLERSIDAWVVTCARLAFDYALQNDPIRNAMGLPLVSSARIRARTPQHTVEAVELGEILATVACGTLEHHWLSKLPASTFVFDFRQAPPWIACRANLLVRWELLTLWRILGFFLRSCLQIHFGGWGSPAARVRHTRSQSLFPPKKKHTSDPSARRSRRSRPQLRT